MKTYGESNKGSIAEYFTAPSGRVRLPKKYGKGRNLLRNTHKKRLLRIQMKRIKRQNLKREIYNELTTFDSDINIGIKLKTDKKGII